MGKIFSAVLIIAVAATASYAAYGASDASNGQTVGSGPNQATVRSSKGVYVEYIPEPTAGQGYVLGTYHGSGTLTFGTSAGDTKIYKQDGTGKNVPATVPTGTATVDFAGAGWTMM